MTTLRSRILGVVLFVLPVPVQAVPPPAPTNLTAVGADGVVALDWDDVVDPDLDLYQIYRSTNPGGPHAPFDEAPAGESNFLDPFVTNGVTYYYVVTAENGDGEQSGFSNEASATPDVFDNLISAFRIEGQSGNPVGTRSIAIDAGGDIIVGGSANGFADLNADGDFTDFGENLAHGGSDGYISRFTSGGTGVFAVRIGSTSTIEAVQRVSVDDLGNVYGIGVIGAAQSIDLNGDLDFNDANETKPRNFFVTSFDSTGAFRWANRLGPDSSTDANVVAFDSLTGNLILGGSVSNEADLNGDGDETDGIAETGPGVGGQIIEDPFISVFDRNGGFRWTKRLGSLEQFVGETVGDVAFDSAGRVIVVGLVTNTEDADLNGDNDTLDEAEVVASPSNIALANGFLSVFDANGNHIFARRFATGGSFSTNSANKVVVDSADNIYILGGGLGTIDLNADGDFADPDEIDGIDASSAFLTAFDSAGNHLWAKRFSHANGEDEFGSPFTFRSSDLAFDDGNGFLSVVGTIKNFVDLNADGDFTDGPNETGLGISCSTPAECTTTDLFVTTFDSTGSFVGATRIGSQGGTLSTAALAFDTQSDVVIGADVRLDVDLNNDGDVLDAGEVQLLGGTGFAGLLLELDQPFGPPNIGPNAAPVVDAGSDQTVTLDQAFTTGFSILASAFDDGLPDPPSTVDFQWSRISGGGAVNIATPTSLGSLVQLDTLGSHTFRFSADDSALVGSDTMVVRVVVDLLPPAPPTNLRAFPGDAGVFLDWDDNTEPDLQEYVVYFATDAAGPFEEFDQDDPSEFPVFGLTNGLTYFFVVTARDSDGFESGFSNVASATPMAGLGCTLSSECDDGIGCNGAEACLFGICADGTPVDCDDGDFCTIDSCIEPTGACDNAPLLPPTPSNPTPANGATGVATDATLIWDSGTLPLRAIDGLAFEPDDQKNFDRRVEFANETLSPIGPVDRTELQTEFIHRDKVRVEINRALADGLIERPQAAAAGRGISPVRAATGPQNIGTITSDDIFLYEDTDALLSGFFTDGELFAFMFQAANDLMSIHGDNYDFVGFFLNYTPSRQIGSAFYLPVENDVSGIGDTLFNDRPTFGINGANIEGLVMMWVVDDWEPGTTSAADFTRLVLAQEFEHRFGMFLGPVQGGTIALQGDNASCGRSAHWNFRVDGQGSGMEIREWIGNSPAVLGGNCDPVFDDLCFNGDNGGVWSYPDLYLMGYVSAAEMDAGMSEFRYMVDSDCSSDFFGTVVNLSSTDIITASGARSPDVAAAQKDFRTGWIMLHLPGSLPTTAQVDRSVGILNQHQQDWQDGTLSRGTINNALVAPCPVTHDVFFGTTNPPTTLVCDDIEPTQCDPGTLLGDTTYFWQVVSETPAGLATGPVWSFTTEQCIDNADCDDGVFCNGSETCNSGACTSGTDPCPGQFCDESSDNCVDCLADGDCDDSLFCNGMETCDGSGVCQPGADLCTGQTCDEVNDVCIAGGSELWMSFRSNTAVPGVGTVRDEDIVAFDPGTGTWSWIFDGSDVGIGSLEISGMAVLEDGDILMTFTAAGTVPGLQGGPSGTTVDDSDIVRFTPSSLGATTAGSFAFYFDGSDVGLTNNGEDIDAIALDAGGQLVLSMTGTVNANGVSSLRDEDILTFADTSLGATTAGTFSLLFDGSDVGLNQSGGEDIDAASFTTSGDILFSTVGDFSVVGVSGADEDIVEFVPTSLGTSTSGSFSLLEDLSALGIATGEDIGSLELVE